MVNRIFKYGVVLCLLVAGCNKKGIVLELHAPSKPGKITFIVDKAGGEAPHRVKKDTYKIQLSVDGVATIDSLKKFEQWHQKILVVNGIRITNFYLKNAKLNQAFEFSNAETGGSLRRSKEDGTIISYDVIYTK